MSKKTFNCIFPGLYNYILAKDVGMIPYMLSYDFNASITTYDNDNFTYLKTIFNDKIILNFLNKTDDEKKDVLEYIKSEGRNIDVMQLYHLRYKLTYDYIKMYRKVNPEGKIYLKLDANNEIIDFLVNRPGLKASLRRRMTKEIFKKIDIISIETKRNYNELLKIIPEDKLLYMPNGILEDSDMNLNSKKNIILYVGHIECKNKKINMLLNAARQINLKDWKIVLVGEVKDDMQEFLKEYFIKYPYMKDKVDLVGYIEDKEKLSEYYSKAKIYTCTSDIESFGISTLEAAYHGCYIISTDVGGSSDILQASNYGKLIEHDANSLKEVLNNTINNWTQIAQDPYKISCKILDNFSWKKLCGNLEARLKKE